MDPLRIETIDDLPGLEALAPEWDDLVRAAPRPSPFMLHGWIAEWWRHFGEGRRLTVVTARRGERLTGALPLFVGRHLGVRKAEFLGGHESALGDLLLADPGDTKTARALVEAVGELPLDLVDVFGLPEGSRLASASAGELLMVPRVEAPVMEMPEGWDAAYAAKCKSKKRNLHRRRAKQLAARGTVEWEVARDLDRLLPALEESFALHDARWAGRPDTSTYGTERGRAFQRAAMARIAGLGVPRIVMVRVDGHPVAFHYYFALAGTMYVHRPAFDPAYREASPGLLTLLEALRAASDEGLTRCEFLGGDERYKLELADSAEPLLQGVGLAHGPVGTVAMRARAGAVHARRRLKRSVLARRAWHGQARLRARLTSGGGGDAPAAD
jgi:CelD/BcsL family acetyltransferase involved in cellulose biosynthesis